MKPSARHPYNRIARPVSLLNAGPQLAAPAGFVLINWPGPAQAMANFEFYRSVYNRSLAQVEAVRRRRRQIRAASSISLN
jgi:hypothetical protein